MSGNKMFNQSHNVTSVKRVKYSMDNTIGGNIQSLSNVNFPEHPICSNPMYSSRMTIQGQPQGAYPMNTGPRGADHTGYSNNYGMMSQGEQMTYWTTNNQSAMPGPSRIGPFSSCGTPNAVMNFSNDPQIVSGMNIHRRAGHYGPIVNNLQMQCQQQSMMGMARRGFQDMGTDFEQIDTSGDPFQPLICGSNMGTYNSLPNTGGRLMGQNSAAAQVVLQEQSGVSPYQSQYRSTTLSPSSTPLRAHTQSHFQGIAHPPSYKSLPRSTISGVNKTSICQMVPPNQTTINSPLLNASAYQEISNPPRLEPGDSTAPDNLTARQEYEQSSVSEPSSSRPATGAEEEEQYIQLKHELSQYIPTVMKVINKNATTQDNQKLQRINKLRDFVKLLQDSTRRISLSDLRKWETALKKIFPSLKFSESLKSEKFKELYFKAKHNLGTEELQLYKLVIFGPPGVGKSSLFQVLLDKYPDIVRNSTGAFNRKLVQVKVAISTLTDQSKSSWHLISIEDEISRLRSIIERVVEDPKLEEVRLPENFVDDKSQMKVEEKLLQPSAKVPTKIKNISTLMACYDSGGQPEFFDVMPALTTTPTGNIMVFNLSKNLNSKVDSEFYEEGHSSKSQYQAHYTTAELMKTAIANIQSYSNKKVSVDTSIASSDEPNAGRLLVVGTHFDLCGQTIHEKQQKVDEIEKVMCSDILAGEAMQMVHCDYDNRIVHSISNTDFDGRDEAAQKIRTAIEDMSKHAKSYSEIPINWLLFQLEVQLTDKDYIGRSKCIEIAKGCYIKENEVDYVLMYFHELGILLHYREVSGLKNIIFCNPQWLFDQLTELIKFKYKATPMIQKTINKGILYKQRLCEIYSKKLDTEGELKTEDLFELFIHLKVMSLLPNKPDQYFMPALLNPAPTNTSLQEEFGRKVHDTMLVKFEDRYFPRGMFCCLVTHLSQNNWEIQFKFAYKNLIVFQYLPNQYVALFDKITYMAVEIHCKNDESNFRTDHYEICIALYDSLKELCKMFQMSYDFELGFVCKNCKGFAGVKPLNQYSVSTIYFCKECEISFKQSHGQLAWFLPSDVCKPQVLISQQPTHEATDQLDFLDVQFYSKRPEMWHLIKVVIPKIQSEWEDVAYSMQYDINFVKTIKEDCQNSEKCCKKLFEDWLTTSHGVMPKTWFVLLERIKEVDSLKATVAAIEVKLKSVFALC